MALGMESKPNYLGRFAPSPTGPLHFGSLVAALASYLDARHHKGAWLLRIEDLDPPREQPDAPQTIIEQLTHLGFQWDGEPTYQSHNLDRYQQCLDQLIDRELTFMCTCSRKSFQQVYPGKCRGILHQPGPHAVRLEVPNVVIYFSDLIQGQQSFHLREDIGDFILRRKDGLFAYQLAVVVDDQDQNVTHVIRGSDLLDSTPKQIWLAQCLNFRPLKFGHFPVVVDASGQKLSKQAHAKSIDLSESVQALKQALKFLRQPIPTNNTPQLVLDQAIKNWQRNDILSVMSAHIDSD